MGARAEQQLRGAVTPATAPGIFALAQQQRNEPLAARCVEVMRGHRKNDVWATLDFALTAAHAALQGSCLAQLRLTSRGELLPVAPRLLAAARRHTAGGGAAGGAAYASLADVPLVRMLQSDLVQEAEAAGRSSVAAARA